MMTLYDELTGMKFYKCDICKAVMFWGCIMIQGVDYCEICWERRKIS